MKSLISVILVLLLSLSVNKRNYIFFQPIGASDKSIPTLLICKDSTDIKGIDQYDYLSVVNDEYYDTIRNIVIKSNPRMKLLSDNSGNFEISTIENDSKTTYFLDRKLSIALLRDLIKAVKQSKKHEDLLEELEDILEHD